MANSNVTVEEILTLLKGDISWVKQGQVISINDIKPINEAASDQTISFCKYEDKDKALHLVNESADEP